MPGEEGFILVKKTHIATFPERYGLLYSYLSGSGAPDGWHTGSLFQLNLDNGTTLCVWPHSFGVSGHFAVKDYSYIFLRRKSCRDATREPPN
jgi:hypothetical protein